MADSIQPFTLNSARAALRAVRPVAERLCTVYGSLERLRPPAVSSDERVPPVYFRLVCELHGALGSLEKLGVLVKDPRTGLVDFPARRAGRPVLLCWQVGEETLDFWHDIEDGIGGRQPVDEDGPWDDSLAEPTELP